MDAWCGGASGAPREPGASAVGTAVGTEPRVLGQRLRLAGVESRGWCRVVGLGLGSLLAGHGGTAAPLEGATPLQ
ncbi:hypothetical protein NDU88_002881 [Pleurodeles waltl]|uniref:Uncharacterized protein n=1 Tax=Pleurodeles waltl TaxID=8319 RepID=A0AAV7T361_PLEWA|nr:hypothetical protein NDU88_002881 [Pleurodeles waltl]